MAIGYQTSTLGFYKLLYGPERPDFPDPTLTCFGSLPITEEMTNKARLYSQAGAKEVWTIWENGIVDYYGKMGKIETSGYGVIVKL